MYHKIRGRNHVHRLGNTHRLTNAHDVQNWKIDFMRYLIHNKLIEMKDAEPYKCQHFR